MNVFKNAITCVDCRKILDKPILLPCGQLVCLQHVENLPVKSYDCKSCDLEHKKDDIKLYINKAVESLVKANLEKIDMGAEYNEAYECCGQLDKLIKQFEALREDPGFFINEIVCKFKNQTEILREELKLMIDTKANKIIDELEEYERECKSKLSTCEFKKSTQEIENELAIINKDVNKWEKRLNDFELKDEQKIYISLKCKQNLVSLKMKMCIFKQTILMNQVEQFFNNLRDFLENSNHSEKNNFSFSIIQDLKYLCENYRPFYQSRIVETTELQKKLINLCEFGIENKWTLVYRATEHGFGSQDFHSQCDNVPYTLTIIKSTQGNIFGGFTDVAWDSTSGYKKSRNAFIFSLINKFDDPFKAHIHQNESEFAIYCGDECGPIFGGRIRTDYDDIHISDNSNISNENYSNFSFSYHRQYYGCGSCEEQSILAGSFNFKVENIEVYKLLN